MSTLIFCAVMLASLIIAASSKKGHGQQGVKDFFVASGQFGGVLLFFLSAGETFSVGTVLGFPAGYYAKGTAFGMWYLGYLALAYPVSYFLNPWIWRAGQVHQAVTMPDLFQAHFESRAAEIAVALSAIAFLLPFGDLQFTGLLVVLKAMGWNIPPLALLVLCALMAFSYIVISGIRAPAYVSIMKDILMVFAVVVTGGAALYALGVPLNAHPLVGEVLAAAKPIPTAAERNYATSTILLQALGLCMSPAGFTVIFTARSSKVVRRTQILMPLYLLMFPFLLFVAEFVRKDKSMLASPNDVFLAAAGHLLPAWLVAIVVAGTALAGLVIIAGTCLTIGPLVTRNVMRGLDERRQRVGAQIVIAMYLLLSIGAAASSSALMVWLNPLIFFGAVQTLPGMLVIILARRVSPAAFVLGLLVGDATAIALFVWNVPIAGVNPGLIGLIVNALVLFGGGAWLPSVQLDPIRNRVRPRLSRDTQAG